MAGFLMFGGILASSRPATIQPRTRFTASMGISGTATQRSSPRRFRDELVRQLGYNLIVMWETDWKPEYRRRRVRLVK